MVEGDIRVEEYEFGLCWFLGPFVLLETGGEEGKGMPLFAP